MLVAASPSSAQLTLPGKGEGTLAATVQVVTDHYHYNYRGEEFDAGKITSESLQLKLDYGLTERIAVSLAVPFLRKQYRGARPHVGAPFEHHDGHDHGQDYGFEFLDDGRFHGHWQDVATGVRFRWLDGPVAVTPFVTYAWPSHDYTFYAHAAPGTRQVRVSAGAFVGYRFGPPWENSYLQGYYAYTDVEAVLGIKPNYSTVNIEYGRYFSERLGARIYVTRRHGHAGLEFPIDFPASNLDRTFNHDRVQRIDYTNVGAGVSWVLDERHTLSLDWMTTVRGENGHKIHNAVTLGLYRGF
jgi:hypothetical protein